MMFLKSKSHLSIIQWLRGCCLILLLFILPTHPAQAQLSVICPTCDAVVTAVGASQLGQWAQQIAHDVAEVAEWVREEIQRSGIGNLIANATQLNAEMNVKVSQGNANAVMDNHRQTVEANGAAERQAAATVGANTDIGADAAFHRYEHMIEAVIQGAPDLAGYVARAGNVGSCADKASPAAFIREDCAEVGKDWSFFDPSYAPIVQGLKCPGVGTITIPSPNPYQNKVSNATYETNYQLSLPSTKPTVDCESHVTFPDVANNNGKNWADPVLWIGALRFCEGLRKNDGPTPPQKLDPNQSQIAQMAAWSSETAVARHALGTSTDCFKAVLEATACGKNATTNCAGFAGQDLYSLQDGLCHILKDTDKLNVTATGGTGNTDLDNALSTCDTNGLSLKAAKAIYAKSKTADPSRIASLAASGDGTVGGLRKEIQAAHEQEAQLEADMEQHYTNLRNEYNALTQDKIATNLSKHNEELAEQTKILSEQTKLLTQQNALLSQLLQHDRPVVAGR